MRCRIRSMVIGAAVLLGACSVVLDPGRHRGDGERDGAVPDDGGRVDGGDALDGGGGGDGGGGDGGGGDGGGGDGGPACAAGLTCVAAAPTGWSGPIVLLTGPGAGSPPACPASAPSTAFTARGGLDAPAATCGCSCTPPPPSSMGCGSANLTTTSNTSCITIPTTHATLANGECRSIASLPTSGRWSVSRPAFSSSMGCTAVPATDVPPLAWAAAYRGCGFGAPASCGASSVCVPEVESDGARVCVYVDGEVASCPAEFPEMLPTAADATDDRACSPCSCGAVNGTCGGHVDITNGCPGTLLRARIGVNSCTPAEALPTPMSAAASYTPSATCPPTTPSPTGSATPTGVRTVCCATP